MGELAAGQGVDRRALVYSLTKTMLAAAVLRFAARGAVESLRRGGAVFRRYRPAS